MESKQQDAQGKKVISRAAIKAFESIETGKVVQDERTDEQINGQVGQVIEALKDQLRVKDEQLRAKDEQIESLHEILSRLARGFGVILDMIIFVALFTRAEYSISIGLLDSYIVYKGGSVCSQQH